MINKLQAQHLRTYAGVFRCAVGADKISTTVTECDAGSGQVVMVCRAGACSLRVAISKSANVLSCAFSDSDATQNCVEDIGVLPVQTRQNGGLKKY